MLDAAVVMMQQYTTAAALSGVMPPPNRSTADPVSSSSAVPPPTENIPTSCSPKPSTSKENAPVLNAKTETPSTSKSDKTEGMELKSDVFIKTNVGTNLESSVDEDTVSPSTTEDEIRQRRLRKFQQTSNPQD